MSQRLYGYRRSRSLQSSITSQSRYYSILDSISDYGLPLKQQLFRSRLIYQQIPESNWSALMLRLWVPLRKGFLFFFIRATFSKAYYAHRFPSGFQANWQNCNSCGYTLNWDRVRNDEVLLANLSPLLHSYIPVRVIYCPIKPCSVHYAAKLFLVFSSTSRITINVSVYPPWPPQTVYISRSGDL